MATMSPKRKVRTGPPPRKPSPGNPWPKKLRAVRDKHNLTQAEAAARAGVAARTWIAWENSQAKPSRMATNLLIVAFPELA